MTVTEDLDRAVWAAIGGDDDDLTVTVYDKRAEVWHPMKPTGRVRPRTLRSGTEEWAYDRPAGATVMLATRVNVFGEERVLSRPCALRAGDRLTLWL